MLPTIDQDTLLALGMGAAVLSAGGGSFPYLELLVAAEVLRERGVALLPAAELPDDAHVALVCMAGAPLPMFERFVDADHFARPVLALEALTGRRFDAIMGYEIGSMNGIIPVMIAARTGLPLVDADTMGRSFPQADMSSFALAGVPMTPMVLSDIRANTVVIQDAVDGPWTEKILRVVTTAFGSIAAVASSATGATIKQHGIAGTYSRAIRMGDAILSAQARQVDPITTLIETEGGIEIVRGRIVDIEREATGGFVRGTATIMPANGGPVSVHFQNEYAVIARGDELIATVPDLISLHDAQRGEPIGTEALRYAQQVVAISLPPAAMHRTGAALSVLGPRGFGYDFDYCSPHLKGFTA